MCRNIRPLHNFAPPATHDEVREAALQYVRKISGSSKPSQANAEAFDRAVEEVSAATARLLGDLITSAPPKDREVEAAKRRAPAAPRLPRRWAPPGPPAPVPPPPRGGGGGGGRAGPAAELHHVPGEVLLAELVPDAVAGQHARALRREAVERAAVEGDLLGAAGPPHQAEAGVDHAQLGGVAAECHGHPDLRAGAGAADHACPLLVRAVERLALRVDEHAHALDRLHGDDLRRRRGGRGGGAVRAAAAAAGDQPGGCAG